MGSCAALDGRSSLSGLHIWVAEGVCCCMYRLQRCIEVEGRRKVGYM